MSSSLLNVPPELVAAVRYAVIASFLVSLATRMLTQLRLPVWREPLAWAWRHLVEIARMYGETTRSPIRHPRLELVTMVSWSAIAYSVMIVLLLLVAAIGWTAAFHAPLPAWRYVGILLATAAIIFVAAMAFGEAERARVRAHELRHLG